MFDVHFDDFVEHYRSKYTVFCLQDMKTLADDCYERFFLILENHVRATDARYKNEKPSVIREYITAILPQYFPGKERTDTVNLFANYFLVQMGKDGYITKHNFETLWPRLHAQLFNPVIADARERKSLIHAIARCPAAPAMPKHIKSARSLENDTGNDSSLPLTPEEAAILKKKPYRWTDPAVFIPHMEQFWQHYAKDQRAPSMPVGTLAVVAQDIVTNIQAVVRQRIRTANPNLVPAEFEKRFNAYMRKLLPVPYQYTYHQRPISDPLVLNDVVMRVQTYLTFHLDFERTGVITKEAMLRFFPPAYLRAFDFDQKYSHAHLHTKLDPSLVALANSTLFTSGVLPATRIPRSPSPDAPSMDSRPPPDTLFPRQSPFLKPSDSLRIDLSTLPELSTGASVPTLQVEEILRSATPSTPSSDYSFLRSGSPPLRRGDNQPLISPRRSDGANQPLISPVSRRASTGFDPMQSRRASTGSGVDPLLSRRSSTGSNGSDESELLQLPPIHGAHAPRRTLRKAEHVNRTTNGATVTTEETEETISFVPRSNKPVGSFQASSMKKTTTTTTTKSSDLGRNIIDTSDKATIRAMLTAGSSPSFTSTTPISTNSSAALGSPRNRKASLPELVALNAFQADQVLPEDVTARLPALTLQQLPLLKVWPLALSSSVMIPTSTSAMGPEDIAQPRANARRHSVWGPDISSELLMPLDAEDEADIDRERLRRLTLYAASCTTPESLTSAPVLTQYKMLRKADSLGTPRDWGNSPKGGALERGSLRELATRRSSSPMPLEMYRQKKEEVDDDLPSDVDSDEEAPASEPPKIDLKALSVLPATRRGLSTEMVTVVAMESTAEGSEEDEKDVMIAKPQARSDDGLHSVGKRSYRKLSMVTVDSDDAALLDGLKDVSALPVRPSSGTKIELVEDSEGSPNPESQKMTKSAKSDEVSPKLSGLETPLVVDGAYSTESGDLATEVASTTAVLEFVGSDVVLDAGTLNRPPFARIHPLLKALQQLSGDRLFTGELLQDLLPADTTMLLGKSPESKDLRVRVGKQWVDHVVYVADMLQRTKKHAEGSVIHNTGVVGLGAVHLDDVEMLDTCVEPLRGDASKISNNLMVGKGVEITNRLLQATALIALLMSS